MEIIAFSSVNPQRDIVSRAVSVLKNGGVLCHPTDTCYGLAVDVFQAKAVSRLYRLKKMSFSKPISVLVSGFSEARKYAVFSDFAANFVREAWPGRFTVVLPKSRSVPSFFNRDVSTIGLRSADSVFCFQLIRAFGGPVSSSSANISGGPASYSVSEVLRQFQFEKFCPDLILDGGILPKRAPSRVLFFKDGKKHYLR